MDNELTIDISVVRQNQGLNKYTLLQSESEEILNEYNEVLEPIQGSLTTVSDNDVQSKFTVAVNNLKMTEEQLKTVNKFQHSFNDIQTMIDPNRLQFDIEKAMDDELCIFRNSDNGISNIIIHEDGSLAISFIGYKNSNKKDLFEFYESEDDTDYESIALKFFSI
jgi:hypothetical protein